MCASYVTVREHELNDIHQSGHSVSAQWPGEVGSHTGQRWMNELIKCLCASVCVSSPSKSYNFHCFSIFYVIIPHIFNNNVVFYNKIFIFDNYIFYISVSQFIFWPLRGQYTSSRPVAFLVA